MVDAETWHWWGHRNFEIKEEAQKRSVNNRKSPHKTSNPSFRFYQSLHFSTMAAFLKRNVSKAIKL